MVERETPWTLRQWQWLLLTLAITALVLVNPITHLIGTAVLGGLYYLLVANPKQRQRLLNTGPTQALSTMDNKMKLQTEEVTIYCNADAGIGLNKSKSALQQCLFSFPYLDQEEVPTIHYRDGTFELSATLTSDKYKASLVDYIRDAGFQIDYKN